MLKIDAVKKFLHNQPYELSKLYTEEMEVQVNVARDYGEVITGIYSGKRWHGFTDGLTTWKHFRIPWADGSYADKEIKFDISKHAEAIGMTGWNWIQKRSDWVAFDFDSLIGHKKGLTNDELQEIQRRLEKISFINLYTSTSGIGLHVYIFLNGITDIANHTEHAAVARAILSQISALSGLDLQAKVDCMGGNMWVWHRKAIPGESFECLAKGTPLKEIPKNWRSYIPQRKIVHKANTTYDELCSSYRHIELDEEHLKLIKWFEKMQPMWWWDDKRWMLVCHTFDLKSAHRDLNLKGFFDTIAEGKDTDDQNCFMFPIRRGGWICRRHTKGVEEHPYWYTDKSGWTTCYYNKLPSIKTASRKMGGVEGEKDYSFRTLESAIKTLFIMGIELDIPPNTKRRPAAIKNLQDGRLLISFERHDLDDDFDEWIKKKKTWEKIYYRPKIVEEDTTPDHLVRHLVANDSDAGWFIKTDNAWVQESRQNVTSVLLATGTKRSELDTVFGNCILNNWVLVNKPFQPEYIGNREWNRNAAQFIYNPEMGEHPTWDLVFKHIGKGLDNEVGRNSWCKNFGIVDGLLYLQAWCAALFKEPNEPTPYLFLCGPQNCGKSIFHEGLSLLITRGLIRTDHALINTNGFNGELANAVICIVEETNLSKKGIAADRIKDWVTGRTISIHNKNKTPYDLTNCTHWIQCANLPTYCPILPGDTRITMIEIEPIKNEIAKPKLLEKLRQEAKAFMHTIMNFELPPYEGRLKIPVIETEEKKRQQNDQISEFQIFFKERVKQCNGAMVLISELWDEFNNWLDPVERVNWTKRRMTKELPSYVVKGRHGKYAKWHLGNITLDITKVPCGICVNENDMIRLKTLD